jgi:LPS O-antigen subunit length determinant protein (WzzB/FepE family)
MDKKNNIIIIILAIIILATIVFILKNGYQKNVPVTPPLSQTEIELNQAITSDTTDDIAKNLESINVDEPVEEDDLNMIDQELEKL